MNWKTWLLLLLVVLPGCAGGSLAVVNYKPTYVYVKDNTAPVTATASPNQPVEVSPHDITGIPTQ